MWSIAGVAEMALYWLRVKAAMAVFTTISAGVVGLWLDDA